MTDFRDLLNWIRANVFIIFIVIAILTWVVHFPAPVLGVIILLLAGLIGWAYFSQGFDRRNRLHLAYAAFTGCLTLEGVFLIIGLFGLYHLAWLGSLAAMVTILIIGSGGIGSIGGGRYRPPVR